MKSFFVRLSVLALATTGFAASTALSTVSAKPTVKPALMAMGTGPIARCVPGNGCGSQGID